MNNCICGREFVNMIALAQHTRYEDTFYNILKERKGDAYVEL